jgi:hypothetical protein
VLGEWSSHGVSLLTTTVCGLVVDISSDSFPSLPFTSWSPIEALLRMIKAMLYLKVKQSFCSRQSRDGWVPRH